MKRKRSELRERLDGDLEILPMMNLFVVLIPMLLLSAVFLELSVIRMTLPSDEAAESKQQETLGLSIAIEEARWVVKGRALESLVVSRQSEDAVERLRGALAEITGQFPDNRDVVIVSTPRTRYDDIVKVMDVSRETGIDNISLSGAN